MSIVSEDAILTMMQKYFPEDHPSVFLGRGDDCAVLRVEHPLCLSSDVFMEDVHFRRQYFLPEEIGHKALAVNISDIAAMGARPVGFSLCLGLPADIDTPWLERFFTGMGMLALQHKMVLVGGDLSRSSGLYISITIWGEPVPRVGHAQRLWLTRNPVCSGDSIFVFGSLGLAHVGLRVLEEQGRAACDTWPLACAAHLRPSPKVDAGLICARMGHTSRPPALMDVSDGLMRDLPRLLHGAVGNVELGAHLLIPEASLPAEVINYARECGENPIELALCGGEDYALLGACAPKLLPALQSALPSLVCIGTVVETPGIMCNGQKVTMHGFDHFGG